jgi:phage terminase large subunit-like protein
VINPLRTASDAKALKEGCTFDAAKADSCVTWIEQTFAIELYEWQREILWLYFGWRRADGGYRFTKINVWVPKKNGKSFLIAALIGFKIFELRDGRIYSAACNAKQAKIVMDQLITVCKKSRKLRRMMEGKKRTLRAFLSPFRRDITYTKNGSSYEALADNKDANDGLIPDVLVFDEIHRMQNAQIDVLDGATSNNPTALKVIISTAGSGDKTQRAWQRYDYTRKVLSGEVIDTQLLPIIHECPEAAKLTGQDIYNIDILASCNPVLREDAAKFAQAEREVAEALELRNDAYWRRFRLNQWVATDGEEYIPAPAYAACEVEPPAAEELEGRDCFVGFDKSGGAWDFSAATALFPLIDGRVYEMHWTFAAADRLKDMGDRDDRDYMQDVESGELTVIPAEAVSDQWMYEFLEEQLEPFNVRQIAADPHAASYLLERWKADGFDVVAVQQSNGALLTPVIENYAERVRQHRIVHARNNLVAWQVSCSRAITTAKDRKKIVKAGSTTTGKAGAGHIDNVDSTLNALASLRAAEIDTAAYGDGPTITYA